MTTAARDDEDRDTHGQPDGCPGMWRLQVAVLDIEQGPLTGYQCELCGTVLAVPPSGGSLG